MFIVKVNPNKKHNWLLGDYIGKGDEHIVYAKNDYVYKIRRRVSSNIFDFVEFIIFYLRSRNKVPFLLPFKFVGIAYMDSHFYPIFRLLKVDPNIDYEKYCKFISNNYKVGDRIVAGIATRNFGTYNGKLYAIDVHLKPLSEIDNYL